jgi:hypothetical protein
MANVGDYLTIKGVKKRWAGENYGWQLPATYAKLEKEGKFRIGTQLLDKVGAYLGPAVQAVQGFQKQVRDATPWLDPLDKAVDVAMRQEDRLPSSIVARGGAIAAQRAGNALNLDPRLGVAAGLLIGGVHKDGPKAGTYKWRPTGDLKPHANAIEERIEAAHQYHKQHGHLRNFDKNIRDANGNVVAVVSNKGSINYDNRVGISPIAPKAKPAPAPAAPKSNVSTPVPAPKVVTAPPEVRKQVVETYGLDEDVADRLLKDWEREQTYRANMDIYRNDMLYQEKLLKDVIDTGVLPPSVVGKTRSEGLQKEIGELRRGRRALVSEPTYIYEDTISKPPGDIEQVHKGVYNAETRERSAAAPIKGTQAHHQGSVSSVESYLQNMSVDEIRETLDLLVEQGYKIGSSRYGFMNLSNAAHTNRSSAFYKHVPEWGDDFAHVGGEGRFKGEPLPKGTTPQQAVEAMKPMLEEQRKLNAAAWNHPAEKAMRQFTEEVMGGPIEWTLPKGKPNQTPQKNAAIEKGLNASYISEAFAKGFAQGKTYEQIANELRNRLKINGP